MKTAKQFISEKLQKIEDTKSREIRMKDIGRRGHHYFLLEKATYLVQSNLKQKVFCFERLRIIRRSGRIAYKIFKKGEIEYRIGYYIVGRIGRAKDRWIWGQFSPLIPGRDLTRLLTKARKEKVLI